MPAGISAQGNFGRHPATSAIYADTAVNPLGVQAQMEGPINFGLAAALKSAITVNRGRVEQSNFHDYEVLRLSDAPAAIDVHILPSTEPPGGFGEPPGPPLAAAPGNANFAATGKHIPRVAHRARDFPG